MRIALFCLSLFISTGIQAESKDYIYSRLANGLDLIVVPSPKVPLATIVLVSKAGAMTETPESNGLTHLWEHMFFKGNAKLPNQEAFKKRIRELGIDFNGDTSAETVRYYFTLPSGNLAQGIEFMADAISTPLLEQSEMERERHVVMDEYDRNASQPGFRLNNIERMLIYGPQEYLRNPLGRRNIIEQASRAQLLKIKEQVFVPQNCALVVAGAVEPAETKKLTEKYFNGWSAKKDWRPIEPPKFPEFPKTTDILMTDPIAQNALLQITWHGPSARHNAQATYAADILIGLLNHHSGTFYQKFIDSGLTFETSFSYQTQGQTGELAIYANLAADKLKTTKQQLLDEVSKWQQPGYFSEEQLNDVKRKLTVSHKFMQNKPSAFARDLAFWWSVAGLDYYDQYIANMQNVTRKQIAEFVEQWLVGKPFLSSTLVNKADAQTAGLKDNSEQWTTTLLKNY